jgi:CO/xanthine dehydrogenase FAD-binding subunit
VFAAGKLAHGKWVDIFGLKELRGIDVERETITLGAGTTYSEVQANRVLVAEFPMLCQAGSETGGVAIQNRGTLGGNIANASPAADSPPALLAYGADLQLISSKGARWVPYDTFHTGYKQMILAPDEIVARIRIPRRHGLRVHFYRKVGPRKAQAISKVCFAGCADVEGRRASSVRIALGGVAPIIPRCKLTEAILRDHIADSDVTHRAKEALASEIAPIDDVRSNARYRRKVAENLLVDFILRLRAACGIGLPS